MVDEQKQIQPKSIAIHTGSYVEFLQRQLGAIDFNQAWSNFFSQMEASIKLIEEIQIASESRTITDPRTGQQIIKNAIIDTVKHPQLILDPIAVYQFLKIWNGRCYISKERDPNDPPNDVYLPNRGNGCSYFGIDVPHLTLANGRGNAYNINIDFVSYITDTCRNATELANARMWNFKTSGVIP